MNAQKEKASTKIFSFALFPAKVTDKVKLHLFPLCVTGVKLLPSLSFCAGRHSTALWTRAPHPKVAYLAPTITLYWGCMIPKMTSHSEKQVALTLIFCVAYCLCCDAWSSYFFFYFFFFLKKRAYYQKAVFHGVIYLTGTHSILLPLHLSLYAQCWRETGVALGVRTCKVASRRQGSCVSKFVRCFHKVKANTEIWVSEVEVCFAE